MEKTSAEGMVTRLPIVQGILNSSFDFSISGCFQLVLYLEIDSIWVQNRYFKKTQGCSSARTGWIRA